MIVPALLHGAEKTGPVKQPKGVKFRRHNLWDRGKDRDADDVRKALFQLADLLGQPLPFFACQQLGHILNRR